MWLLRNKITEENVLVFNSKDFNNLYATGHYDLIENIK